MCCKEMVSNWCNDLKSDSEGMIIKENFDKELDLPEEQFLEFYKRILEKYPNSGSLGLDAKKIIDYCVDLEPVLTLKGTKIDLDDSEELYRLELARRFLFPIINATPKNYHELNEFIKLIIDGELNIEDFKRLKIGNKRNIVWATLQTETNDNDLDDLRDRLGLAHYGKDEDILEVVYKCRIVNKPRKPTVLDAGNNKYFCPGGYTKSLSNTNGKGLKEMVHEKISFKDLKVNDINDISINYKGKTTKSVPVENIEWV